MRSFGKELAIFATSPSKCSVGAAGASAGLPGPCCCKSARRGSGSKSRDFTWVGDVVRANRAAVDSSRVGSGEPINIGSGDAVSINRLAELIGGPTAHASARGFDERFKRASVERAQDLLGWAPAVDIEQGIQQLLDAARDMPAKA